MSALTSNPVCAGVPQIKAAATSAAKNGQCYGRVAICLHWSIGLLLLAQIAFGFLLDDIAPRGTPDFYRWPPASTYQRSLSTFWVTSWSK